MVFALTTLLAIGGSLWVVLRELHRDATIGALTELTVPYAATARSALPQSLLRPGQASSRNLIERIEQRMEGEEFAEELEEFAESFSEDVSDADVAVIFTSGDSSIIFRRHYTYHQSPFDSQGRVLTIAPGATQETLRFPVDPARLSTVTHIEVTGESAFYGLGLQSNQVALTK